jgi:gliding motility-associated-like protein
MKKAQLLCKSLLFLFFTPTICAQVNATFISKDTVCIGEALTLTNTTSGPAETYYWNFCGLDISFEPSPVNLGDLGILNIPVFITIVEEGDNYYGFVSNLSTHALIRLDFGNDLTNVPIAVHLGSNFGIVNGSLEGIAIAKDGNQWWGFGMTGGNAEASIVRYTFGNSIQNIPVAENLGNIGGLDFPHELLLFQENEEWFGWTVSAHGETFTRFSFGESLANTPVGLNIGNVGNLTFPTGFTTFQQNGDWYMLVCNNTSLTRLDFGASLSSIPLGTNLGQDLNFVTARDIILQENCGELIGLVLNSQTMNVTVLDFQGDITNVPLSVPLPSVPELDFPHSYSNIVRFGGSDYVFVVNVNTNSLVRMKLKGCDSAFPANSTEENPPPVVYSEAGEYVIELVVNQGLPSQSNFCKSIVVLPLDFDLGQDTVFCEGTTFLLQSAYSETLWQDGSVGEELLVSETNLYIAQVDTLGCTLRDSVFIEVINCQDCFVFPNAFTPDGDGQNDTFSALNACPVDIPEFELKIFNRWGEMVFITKDLQGKWNGMHKSHPAPTDVYIWQARFAYVNEKTGLLQEFREEGGLTLIR